MANYEYFSWQTIDIPTSASADTSFIVYDHSSSSPGTDSTGIIYSGVVLAGYGIKNLDEILSQYVNPAKLTISNGVKQDNLSHFTFYIYYKDYSSDWTTHTYDTITVIYDWTYINANKAKLSHPVTNILDYRQWFLSTLKSGTPDVSSNVAVTYNNTQIDSFSITGYTYYTYVKKLPDIILQPLTTDDMKPLTIGTTTYYVTNTCSRYCLYYLNRYGGWDSMLFKGKELESDNLSRLSYKTNFTAMSSDFCKVDYLTKINETFSLNTSYLDDSQSSRMIELLSSNRIYLHDLVDNVMIPVNITNSTCEHKTYKNQGRKMSVYTVTVEASQPKYRV